MKLQNGGLEGLPTALNGKPQARLSRDESPRLYLIFHGQMVIWNHEQANLDPEANLCNQGLFWSQLQPQVLLLLQAASVAQ